MAVYNGEKTVEKMLDSLLESFRYGGKVSHELLIVNDGSTDRTAEILEQYVKKHSFVRTVFHENAGLGPTRNKGLIEAKGKYIWFVDADDIVPESAAQNITPELLNQNIDIIIFDYEHLPDPKLKPESMHKMDAFIYRNAPKTDFTARDYPDILTTSHLVWNKLFRRDFLIENNIRFLNERSHEDIPIHIRALCSAQKIHIKEGALLRYCTFNSVLSKPNDKLRILAPKAFEECEEYFEKNPPFPPEVMSAYYVFKANHLFWVFYHSSPTLQPIIKEYNDKFMKSISKHELFLMVRSIFLRPDVTRYALKINGFHESMINAISGKSEKSSFISRIFKKLF
jgi:glycosyltransferase involved in cell wall biosynthesis